VFCLLSASNTDAPLQMQAAGRQLMVGDGTFGQVGDGKVRRANNRNDILVMKYAVYGGLVKGGRTWHCKWLVGTVCWC
jgi:hypothetical protein